MKPLNTSGIFTINLVDLGKGIEVSFFYFYSTISSSI